MRKIIIQPMLAIIFVIAFTHTGFAQSAIEDVAKRIEKSETSDVTYTEKRNPSTKKVIKSTRVINFKDESFKNALEDAFEKERSNSVSSTYTKGYFFYKFSDGSSYYFSRRKSNGCYKLLINIVPDKKGSTANSTGVYGLEDLESLKAEFFGYL